VDRKKGAFDGRAVHESWVAEGPTKALDAEIVHLSFRNYSELIAKMERYSNIGAEDLYGKKESINAFKPISHGFWMFFKTYFLEQGVLDGFDGLVISMMNGLGSFFKYAKLLELNKSGEKSHFTNDSK
jgi:hypothetical protein